MKADEITSDPAQLAIFRALIEAILDETGEALRHGAFSQNIKERRDFSCALFERHGHLVMGAAHIPVHLGSMDTACKAALEAVEMKPGDAVVLNDPFHGGTHLPDITIIFPAFISNGAEPDFLVGVRAHHADVGGIAPGSLPLSTELSQEGIVIPPTLIVRDGKVIDKTINMIALHSRQPSERAGDLRAQLASGTVALKRLGELAHSRGIERIRAEANHLIVYSSKILASFLRQMKPGAGEGIAEMDEIPGDPGATIKCRVELINDKNLAMKFDFSESSNQHPGCLNATPAIVRSAVLYCLRLFLPHETPTTSGLLKGVKIELRKGSVVDPYPGAAVAGGNVETSQAIVEAVLKALNDMGWDVP
ncbi:MAG TPA: hydantoinase B/oxoprolinase family protein, partial [Firmicutes bacterium]|nr:hydantoinase B/oxoprolinase family protein [Bacillota bacterium]